MAETNSKKYDCNSLAVSTLLTINSEIINRLANNSNICKTLAITLSGAVVGLSSNLSLWHILFVIIVVLMLLLLDSLYMGLKKRTEEVSMSIIVAAKAEDSDKNPYDIKYSGKKTNMEAIETGFKSSTVWPFYIFLIAGLIVLYFF